MADDYVKLGRSDVTTFDTQATALILRMGEHGWLGKMSSKGHAIMRAPDGVTTMAVARDSKRGRSGRNQEAEFLRWLRAQDVEAYAPEGEELEAELFVCEVCRQPFTTARGLSSHARKHTLVEEICPICQKPVKYLDSHKLRSHGVGAAVNAVEALMTVLAELETLRVENARYRLLYGPLD